MVFSGWQVIKTIDLHASQEIRFIQFLEFLTSDFSFLDRSCACGSVAALTDRVGKLLVETVQSTKHPTNSRPVKEGPKLRQVVHHWCSGKQESVRPCRTNGLASFCYLRFVVLENMPFIQNYVVEVMFRALKKVSF